MKAQRAKAKRATPEQRLAQLQTQIAAKKKREDLRQTIAKARQDLKALSVSRK